MRFRAWLASPQARLDVVAGTIDGILNALILAAGHVLNGDDQASAALAWRVGAAAALTTLFVFFVAHYAQFRADLVHKARQLNLRSHGRLATTRLGRQVLEEALTGATIAAACGFVGASFPLLLSSCLPGPGWIALAVAVAALGLLGAALARSFYGSVVLWSGVIMAGGIVLALVGARLNLVD
jgi:predicted membrane protein (TIGR00267 family)